MGVVRYDLWGIFVMVIVVFCLIDVFNVEGFFIRFVVLVLIYLFVEGFFIFDF